MINHHLADHTVHDCTFGTCVKFKHKGYEISLAADGENTLVYSKENNNDIVAQFFSTDAQAVFNAVAWIDDQEYA